MTSATVAFEPDPNDESQLAAAKAILDIKKADPGYDKGVGIFTGKGGGLMYEASVDGQKFKYETVK